MKARLKNIIIELFAALIVCFLIFGILYWLFNKNWNESIELAIAGALGGLLSPYIVSYFKRKKEKKKISG